MDFKKLNPAFHGFYDQEIAGIYVETLDMYKILYLESEHNKSSELEDVIQKINHYRLEVLHELERRGYDSKEKLQKLFKKTPKVQKYFKSLCTPEELGESKTKLLVNATVLKHLGYTGDETIDMYKKQLNSQWLKMYLSFHYC